MFRTGKVLFYKSKNDLQSNEEIVKIINNSLQDMSSNEIFPESIQSVETKGINKFAHYMPIGTIIAKVINKNDENIISICYPMFSLHLSLPVKPGEIIWIYEDNSENMAEKNISKGFHFLNVKHYWLSRKIGSMFSEDVNFANIQSDSLLDDSIEDEDLQISSLIKNPDLQDAKHYSFSFKDTFRYPTTKDLYLKEVSQNNLRPKVVPRWYSNSSELSLQGSNNTLVNLTTSGAGLNTNNVFKKNGGAIDIVVGRHSLYYFDEPEAESLTSKNENINIDDKMTLTEFVDNIIDKDSPITYIKNIDYDEDYQYELLKSNEFYLEGFSDIFDNNNSKESFKDFDNDASRIYISEFEDNDSLDFNTEFYDSNFKNIHHIKNSIENSSNFSEYDLKGENKILFKQDSILKVENYNSYDLDPSIRLFETSEAFNDFTIEGEDEELFDDNLSPFIMIKSNNVRIVARKEKNNEKNKIKVEEGSISFVKESNDFRNYSHITLQDDGVTNIDCKELYLGNIIKEYIRQNIITVSDDEDIIDEIQEKYNKLTYEDVKSMHGKGEGVLLGYDPKFSEPLVLGNTLNLFLKEILNINIEALTYISSAFKEISANIDKINKDNAAINKWAKTHTHINTAPPGGGPVAAVPTGQQLSITDNHSFKKTDESHKINGGEEVQRLTALIDNLYLILSRFSKTT